MDQLAGLEVNKINFHHFLRHCKSTRSFWRHGRAGTWPDFPVPAELNINIAMKQTDKSAIILLALCACTIALPRCTCLVSSHALIWHLVSQHTKQSQNIKLKVSMWTPENKNMFECKNSCCMKSANSFLCIAPNVTFYIHAFYCFTCLWNCSTCSLVISCAAPMHVLHIYDCCKCCFSPSYEDCILKGSFYMILPAG